MTEQEINKNVGKRLRLQRINLGLSQEAIAKAVGITFQQVQKYEKGSNAMNANRIHQFATIMHVPPAYFFEDTESLHKHKNEGASDKSNTLTSERESLEMMKAYKNVNSPLLRKRLADFVRILVEFDY